MSHLTAGISLAFSERVSLLVFKVLALQGDDDRTERR